MLSEIPSMNKQKEMNVKLKEFCTLAKQLYETIQYIEMLKDLLLGDEPFDLSIISDILNMISLLFCL
jgi:hypothetical protein